MAKTYWQENLHLIFICLVIWFIVSFGFGILLVEPLNTIRLGGYKLGFWFAQQGSIYTFMILIFWYSAQMNKLDKKHFPEIGEQPSVDETSSDEQH
jgi:putative solute:sodium symporter small subunit